MPRTREILDAMLIFRFLNELILSSLALLLSTIVLCSAQSAQGGPLVEGNTAFALDLYTQLKTSPGNLFFSPYSISTCLAMTYAGASGETEKQMARVLHFPAGEVQVSFGELQRQLAEAEKQKGIQSSIANALWAQEG